MKSDKKYNFVGGSNLMEAIKINGFSVKIENDPKYISLDKLTFHVKSEEGGIIVLPIVNESTEHSINKLLSFIKSTLDSISPMNYQIKKGKYVRGHFETQSGSMYNENSHSIEITGISSEFLFKIAVKLAHIRKSETFIVKDYQLNKIFLLKLSDFDMSDIIL